MGYSHYDAKAYTARAVLRAETGRDSFEHNEDIQRGVRQRGTHESMNPFRVNRESRDSEAHPESNAIVVMFDVTGSMHSVPRTFQSNLNTLMELMLRRQYLPDPQLLIGAVGDAVHDISPLQVGQFESGIEIDNDLSRIYLEGGGGSYGEESYEMAAHFALHHTLIDCHEKRNKRGYMFLFGDERPYPSVDHARVTRVMGDETQSDVTTVDVFTALRAKYDTFFIIPAGTSGYDNASIVGAWEALLEPHHVLRLADPSAVSELVATAIGLCEGYSISDLEEDLKEQGRRPGTCQAVMDALKPLSTVRATTRTRNVIRT